jgi:hypothetical protein
MLLIALKDVDCCFGDGRVDGGVHSYEAALEMIKQRNNVKQTTAYFLHSPSHRLIEKPKNNGCNWVGYPNFGWLFLWADARIDPVETPGAADSTPESDSCHVLAGTWVPTRIDEWRNCPVARDARLSTYKYVVEPSGDWVDEYEPMHHGQVSPSATPGVFEGYGIHPGKYKARWTLQPDGILELVFGDRGEVTYYVVKEGDKRASTVKEDKSLPSVFSSNEDIAVPFVVRHRGKLLGLRVGRLHPKVHDPYRCNGGGVEGEYGQGSSIQVCHQNEAMTLVFSRTTPHPGKLLDQANPARCINVYWWKLNEGTGVGMYDAYPTGPATGMRYTINLDGTIAIADKRSLVLGLTSAGHGEEEVLQLVPHGDDRSISLEMEKIHAAASGWNLVDADATNESEHNVM